MQAARSLVDLHLVPVHRRQGQPQVGDELPAAVSPEMMARLIIRDAGCVSRLVTTRAPFGQYRPERHAEPRRDVGRDVHVDQPGRPVAAEHAW